MNDELQQVEATTTGSDHQNDYSQSPSPAAARSCSEIKNEEKEDVEGGSIATCRICLQSDGNQVAVAEPEFFSHENLISPCLCNGTQQFVHRSCLDHWRSVKEGFAFSHCTTCKAQFHLRVVEFEEKAWRKIKLRLFIAKDVFLVFSVVQIMIGLLGGLAYCVVKCGALRNSLNRNLERILLTHPIPLYYCVGVLVFVAFLYLFGVIWLIHLPYTNNDLRTDLCQICCCGFDSFSASVKACFSLVVALVVLFATIGIVIAVLAMIGVIQRSWQRHYHILTKRELTQEYVVEDLNGCYTPAKLDPKHVERLKMLELF